MMERGVVLRSRPSEVDVTMTPSDACDKCGACSAADGGRVLEGVGDRFGANPGDVVDVTLAQGARTRASLIAFGVPILLLLAGYLAGRLLGSVLGTDPDGTGVIVAGISLLGALAWMRMRGRTVLAEDRFRPVVHAIIRRNDSD